jgi:hypothetical protein
VSSDGIDPHKVRKLFSSPPQAIGKVVAKLEKANLAALRATPGHDVDKATALQRQVDLLEAGHFGQLDPQGPVGAALLGAANGWTSGLGLVAREAWSKYSIEELTAQVVQRVSQAAHGLVLGSAAATVLPRAVAAVYGGTSHLPNGVIGGLTASSFAMGFIGAITQFKSQTQKNYNKERSKDLEPEGPLTQIGKGIAAGVLLATENRQSNTAANRATELLRRSREDLEWIRALRAAIIAAPTDEYSGRPADLALDDHRSDDGVGVIPQPLEANETTAAVASRATISAGAAPSMSPTHQVHADDV